MPAQSQFLDLYRSMARSTAESIIATLESTQRIHQKQVDIARAALEQGRSATRQLSDVENVDDVVSAQSQLIGAQVAHGLEMWRSAFRSFGDIQMTLLSQMQSQVGQATDCVRQAYDLTRKATEDATRIAATQVTSAANNGSGTQTDQQRRTQETQQHPQHRKSA